MFESDQETEQPTKFQWVVPFLSGLVLALLITAGIIAAYLMRIGPFESDARQSKIEDAVNQATDEIRRQVDQAAFDQENAADPALAALAATQGVTVGSLKLGPNSVQAVGELASAEARGLAKCEPALAALDPAGRAALTDIKCSLTQIPGGASVSLNFAGGKMTSMNYALGGGSGPAPASGDAPPVAVETPAGSNFDAPPAAPSDAAPPAAIDVPPPGQ
ncbi:MAG: hypothetical protein ABWZ40_03935 [Caulobacterales bacterium]